MAFTHTTVSGFLTKEECDTILDFSLQNLILKPAEVVEKNTPDYDVRKSNVVFYPYYKKFPFLLNKITKLLYNNIRVKGFDLDYEDSEFQFTEYNKGDFFNWHKDVYKDEITEIDRYCSLVIQLNDDYEDGNLELKLSDNQIMKVEKETGSIIVFLSNTEHQVTKVKNGNRYTLVNWIGLKKNNNHRKTLL